MKKASAHIVVLSISVGLLSGCWAAAAGLGAEAGYLAAQDDRSVSETIIDQSITATIKTRLLADPTVSGSDVNVDTFKSIVTLRGMVRTLREAERALSIARETSGVRAVQSKLVVG